MRFILFLLVVILCEPACVSAQKITVQKNRPQDEFKKFDPSEHHGIWRSAGYGYYVEISSQGVTAFHVADDICVKEPDNEFLEFYDLYKLNDDKNVLVLSSTLDLYEFLLH